MRYVITLIAVGLLFIEGAARLCGLGTALLYERTEYGYRVAPSQSVTRLGRQTFYNDLGLRNEATMASPVTGALRVLCVGDSITFGGTMTDQEQTYPYLLQKALSQRIPGGSAVEVLNASAGGWATENAEGWIRKHGTLGAGWLVLQVATHDLFQATSSADIVGNHPQFPDRQPVFALQEAVQRYVLPRLVRGSRDPGVESGARSEADVSRALGSLERIAAMARRADARVLVLLVEQPRGLEPEDQLTVWAKAQLMTRLSQMDVALVRPAPSMEQAGGARLFRDGLHPNAEGNHVLAREVAGALHKLLSVSTRYPNL